MIYVLLAFLVGAIPPMVLLVMVVNGAEAQQGEWVRERAALLDRIQSPDLNAYYASRAAYVPDEYVMPEPYQFEYDDNGFVLGERLPGELPPDA